MDLRDLFTALRARWVMIVAVALIGGLLGLGLSLLTTPTYQSQIQLYTATSSGDSAAASYQGSLGAQQKVQSYAALVKSRDIARQVINAADVEVEVDTVINSVTATADSRTVLLNVTVQDNQPERALKLARGFGEVLPTVVNALETPDGGGPALTKLTVVNPPTLPVAPIAPRTELNVALGAVAGLLIGVVIALLTNLLDRRIKTQEQIEDVSGSAVVGSIPYRKAEDRADGLKHIVPFKTGHSPAAEAFRRLRTNLQFLNVDNPPRVLVLTSSVASEGKSETAVNIALAIAEAGHSVLLVEADMRRPRVVNYMNMPDKVGLTNVLAGQASFADVVQTTRNEGVDLLACGPLPPNPSELLASDMATNLISELRTLYDYVIIDTPPLLPVTDGALLARITDGALIVVRTHRTTSDELTLAVDALRKTDASLLGVVTVANRPAKKSDAAYGHSYYYYSSKKQISSDGPGAR